eukprot:2885061-Pyramimonas_sp.AAC.1
MTREQLMKVTHCKRCLQKGHWSRECPNPPGLGRQAQGFGQEEEPSGLHVHGLHDGWTVPSS